MYVTECLRLDLSINSEKRAAAEMMKPKPKPQKKKKKKDPNEPQKPVSAYALFFRDTQAAIKGQNPNATFGDVSKIVASMWDSLGEEQKQGYKRKTEAAKKEYLKALAAYRASLVSKGADVGGWGL
ncbi:TOX high mobility group box family member 2 [Liparis tanakae]|uniref:TOX high mobility group box family member 2 n=1 Tax=Liparis tanakae TaxID=230148 RepID=A0A4Z2JD29_9TELE|nr:TOX high mobility group box family member 2 [Liparis tanakae]